MSVYYRGPRALVTDKAIDVAHLVPRSYLLAELRAIHIVRQKRGSGPGNSRVLGVSALVGAVVTTPVIWRASSTLAVVILVVCVLYAVLTLRVGPEVHHELVATYRGRRTIRSSRTTSESSTRSAEASSVPSKSCRHSRHTAICHIAIIVVTLGA